MVGTGAGRSIGRIPVSDISDGHRVGIGAARTIDRDDSMRQLSSQLALLLYSERAFLSRE